MRAVDVAVLVGQAVAAMADDRLDAAGEVRGLVLMLYGIRCTFAFGGCLRQPANAFAGAQCFPVLDGVEEPICRNAEGNGVLTCANAREEAAAPGDVHAVVRAGQAHLPKRRCQHHDHAAGHLAIAAALRAPTLHDERGARGGKLRGQLADVASGDAGDRRGPCGRFRHVVVAGAAQVIHRREPQAAPVLGQRLVGEPDAALAQEIPVQRVVRERQLV